MTQGPVRVRLASLLNPTVLDSGISAGFARAIFVAAPTCTWFVVSASSAAVVPSYISIGRIVTCYFRCTTASTHNDHEGPRGNARGRTSVEELVSADKSSTRHNLIDYVNPYLTLYF